MRNRWCIISGPRSGSTWIEKSIFNAIQTHDPSAQRLQEIINPNFGLKNTIKLLPDRKIEFIEGKKIELQNYKQLLDYIAMVMTIGDKNQGLTCKVFPQENHFAIAEYSKFFEMLCNNQFQFIHLKRNLFDRTVSFYFALETDVWHRIIDEQNQIEMISSSGPTKNIVSKEITIDISKFINHYKYLQQDEEARQTILSKLPHIEINYETLNEDICQYDIPFFYDTVFLKIYEQPYKEIISNYDQLVQHIKTIR
jgi:hypothetical protein